VSAHRCSRKRPLTASFRPRTSSTASAQKDATRVMRGVRFQVERGLGITKGDQGDARFASPQWARKPRNSQKPLCVIHLARSMCAR
jgi:hypothetical protein